MKVNLDSTKKKAVSVAYINASGKEFEQPKPISIILWRLTG